MKNSQQTSPDSKFKYKLVEFEKEICCFRKRCYLIHQNSYKFQILNARRGPNIEQDKKFTYTPTRKKNQRILKILGFLIQKQNLDGFFPVNYQPKKKPEQEKDQAKQRFETQLLLNHKLQHPTKILARKSSLTRGSLQITQLKTIRRRRSRTTV